MTLYTYQKEDNPTPLPPPTFTPPPPPSPPPIESNHHLLHIHLVPALISIIGLMLVTFVAWPIFSYELTNSSFSSGRTSTGLLNPESDEAVNINNAIGTPQIVGDVDYTKASNWFPTNNFTRLDIKTPTSYTLSIPKLRIENAEVVIGSDDLSKNLIHYNETALPGQLGSPVIFGHSILPQFYNPKNYISIFSTLPTLDPGDEIIVNYDGITYTYVVSEKQEVYPEDLWVLEQHYDQKNIKLITCVPPGLKIKRLVVTANLKSS